MAELVDLLIRRKVAVQSVELHWRASVFSTLRERLGFWLIYKGARIAKMEILEK
jgi:hypothetical protein